MRREGDGVRRKYGKVIMSRGSAGIRQTDSERHLKREADCECRLIRSLATNCSSTRLPIVRKDWRTE